MRIKEISLEPFGNLNKNTFDLEKGTPNIFLGDTGAGKTTVFDALYGVFFIDSGVSKANREYKKHIKKRFPLDGSNVVNVRVKFEHEGNGFEIEKKWNESKKGITVLKGDSLGTIEGDKDVNKKLQEILPSNKGTFKNVLMAYQTKIQDVFEMDTDTQTELDKLLRESIKSDGISPQEFLIKVEKELEVYGDKWDFDRERPEFTSTGNRYKGSKGEIHDLYWEMEDQKRGLDEIERLETATAEINEQMDDITNELKCIGSFLDDHRKAYQDSDKRKDIEFDIKDKERDYDSCEDDFERWDEAEKNISQLEGRVEVLEDNLSNKQEKKAELDRFSELYELSKKIDIEEGKLEAGELEGNILGKEKTSFEVYKDTSSDPEGFTLAQDEVKEVKAKGILQIHTDRFHIDIHSGMGDFEQVLENVEVLKDHQKEKADEYGITLPLQERDPAKKLEDIKEEISAIKGEIKDAHKDIEHYEETISEIKNNHEISSKSEISEKRIELKKEIGSLKEKLRTMADIPEGFEDTSEFRERYEEYRGRKEHILNEKSKLLEKLNQMETPSSSSQELQESIEELDKRFQRALKIGKAYLLLKDRTQELMEDGSMIYGELKGNIERHLKSILNIDGFEIQMDEVVLQGLDHPEGYTIPRSSLSTGQKDIVALALRLAMAEYYLQGTDGFIAMDDPLVNIDPGKRKAAADTIQELSEGKQVLIMTCDPAHAELFEDANVIEV